jgi:hypothetical protein
MVFARPKFAHIDQARISRPLESLKAEATKVTPRGLGDRGCRTRYRWKTQQSHQRGVVVVEGPELLEKQNGNPGVEPEREANAAT